MNYFVHNMNFIQFQTCSICQRRYCVNFVYEKRCQNKNVHKICAKTHFQNVSIGFKLRSVQLKSHEKCRQFTPSKVKCHTFFKIQITQSDTFIHEILCHFGWNAVIKMQHVYQKFSQSKMPLQTVWLPMQIQIKCHCDARIVSC